VSVGAGRVRAQALDAADPLASFRHLFVEPDPALIYLDGNSLGRLPRVTQVRLADLIAEGWAGGLVRSWESWIDLPLRVGDLIADSLLGARPGEVLVCDSTTVNLYKLAVAALDARPGRRTIVTTIDEFPTDRYVLSGLADARDLEIRAVAADGVHGPTYGDLVAALNQDVALVCLSHVGYRSGALANLPAITAAAHDVGALTLWDLSHSVGSVPIGLTDSGADLAVGCTYKYLNAGPGAPAFLYVRRELQNELRQPIWGWFGQRNQFAMEPAYDPAAGVRSFLTGTPGVLGLVAVEEGVRLLAEAGLDRLRDKGMALTGLAVELADAWLADLGFEVASPRDPAWRGSHLTLRHPQAWPICRALIEDYGVVGDFRAPDRLRLGPVPLYTRFTDVWDAFDRIRSVVAAGEHLAWVGDTRRVT
jgi:kynureninase